MSIKKRNRLPGSDFTNGQPVIAKLDSGCFHKRRRPANSLGLPGIPRWKNHEVVKRDILQIPPKILGVPKLHPRKLTWHSTCRRRPGPTRKLESPNLRFFFIFQNFCCKKLRGGLFLPESNSKFAPENGWLEYDRFLVGQTAYFQVFLVLEIGNVKKWDMYYTPVI